MTKQDIINQICADLKEVIVDNDKMQYINAVITKNLSGYALQRMETAPSVQVYDNDYIIRRYEVDLIATEHSLVTIKAYKYIINKFFDETHLCYRYVTSQDITDYLAVLKLKKNASLRYLIHNQKVLRAFFNWAYRKDHIGTDITKNIDSIKNRETPNEKLTENEIVLCRRLLTTDTDKEKRRYALFELMLSTGMRVGELVRVNIEDIDFTNNKMIIHSEKNSERRIGFLTKEAAYAIKDYIGDRSSGALFLSRTNERLSHYSLEAIAKQIGEIANCHTITTVHIYRKTFASLVYEKTHDIWYVSRLLGHKSPTITSKTYIVGDLEQEHRKYA